MSWLWLVGCVSGSDPLGLDNSSLNPEDILTEDKYTQLRIEIDYVSGKGPNDDALDAFVAELEELSGDGLLAKSGGITAVLDQSLPEGDPDAVHTFEELDETLQENAGDATDGETAILYMYYTDGHYEADTDTGSVLGFAYGGNKIVMLRDNLDSACASADGPLISQLAEKACENAETTVLMHEVGHLLGLVNNGVEMVEDHQDSENGAHDVNTECLMYWSLNQSGVMDTIIDAFLDGNESVAEIDDACRADLAAVQAR